MATRSKLLFLSISLRIFSDPNAWPGSEGSLLFSTIISSIGWVMRRDAALNAARMLARSLWLHLDLWWNFVCNRTIFTRFLEIRLSLVPAQTLSYKNRNQTLPLEINNITNSRSPYSENRCIVYCLKYQDFPDFYTIRFRMSGSNLKSVSRIRI